MENNDGINVEIFKVPEIAELDNKILSAALKKNNAMTTYQCDYFVAGSQITEFKRVQQSLLELETRYHAFVEIETSLNKSYVKLKMLRRDIESATDDLLREMLEIDYKKALYDISIWERKIKQSRTEMSIFTDIIKRSVKDESDIEYYCTPNEHEERQYWVHRLGKQSAMDILSFGRIGTGNMDSIAMMNEQDQISTLEVATRYSGLVQIEMDKINKLNETEYGFLSSNTTVQIPKLENK